MKSDKEETMMTAKLINVEGSKIKIELTLELSRSMLDTEINIQKGLSEVGCIASKEALKYLDTDGSPLKIGEEIWKSKGEQPKEYQTPYGEVIVNRHVYQRSPLRKNVLPLRKRSKDNHNINAIIGKTGILKNVRDGRQRGEK
jgi:hypothetical protein